MHRSTHAIIGAALAAVGAAPAAAAVHEEAAASHTYRGPAVSMRFGPVQVTITVAGRRVTRVSATAPTDRARSRFINSRAVPTLDREALAAQRASIHLVSGATLTSRAFVSSLQSALRAAHV